MEKMRALWQGDLPLAEAFWTWGVTVGLAVNMATSAVFLLLILNDLPLAAVAVGYGLSLPYNLLATVGVWRAAALYDGPTQHADLARGATLILMLGLSVT